MKILLAVDGSDYTKRMLAYIAAHDELLGANHEYTALTVVTPIPGYAASYLQRSVIDSAYQEQADMVFAPILHFAAQQGWDVTTRFAVGHAADAIAELAQSGNYDLVIMGTHGHSPLGSVVLGSVAMRVIGQCKTPVLLVR